MEFGLTPGALEAQEQAVIRLPWIRDACFIHNEGIGQGTDFEQAIPVAGGAGEARDFQAEAGPGVPSPDLGDAPLEAIAVSGRGPGVPLILINDRDGLPQPS